MQIFWGKELENMTQNNVEVNLAIYFWAKGNQLHGLASAIFNEGFDGLGS